MHKSQRLLQLMMLVNEKRRFTVRELADELGVSRRTILRDLGELDELGVPLYSEVGAAGGYRVLNDKMLPPIYFTENEAAAIFFASRSLEQYSALPFESGERHAEMYKTDDTIVIAFPTSDAQYVLGLMFPLTRQDGIDRMKEAPEEGFRAAVDVGMAHTDVPARLREARLEGPIKGLLGYDNDWHTGMGDGWALVGDALTFKDPAVGQGLHDALYGARTLAATLSHYGKDRWRPSWEEMAARYEGAMKAKLTGMFHLGCKFSKLSKVAPEEEAVNALIGSDPEATRTFLGLYNYTSGPEDVEREVGRLLAKRSIS